MRVAIVAERVGGGSGGVERAAFELARELGRRSVHVTAVCRGFDGEPPEGVRVERVSAPRVWQPLRVALFSRAAHRATASRYDVVHGFSRTRWQDVYRAGGGSHAAYMERVYARPRLRRLSPRHAVILAIEEAVFRDPRQIVQCNAPRNAEEIVQRYRIDPVRVVSIWNGVDVERFHPARRAREREKMREELRVAGPVALFAGSGFARKGLDLAIDGLARARVRATLLVAGAGPVARYRERASRLGVATRVRFLGHRSDLGALHAAADGFVLPTRYDPFSNACAEAMASGLPVWTTSDNGVADLIRDGENGWIVGDDGWGEAFDRLGDADALAAVGARARETIEPLTWERHGAEVLALYERIRT
jgi:UDP-glucose:(heptosyl)LPS alpha-1,3-glucosyltransferase